MSFRYVSRAIAGVVVLTGAAHAQVAPAPASSNGFLLGAGVDPIAPGSGPTSLAVALHGGYEHRVGRSRFGLRLEGTYWRRSTTLKGYQNAEDYANRTPPAQLDRTVSIGGVNVLGTYQFAPAARVRPYALAGVGYARLSERRIYDPVYPGSGASRATPFGSLRATSIAYSGGLGAAIPLGRAAIFLEGRVTRLPSGDRDLVRGIQGRTTPFVLGLRF